jgi:hypothetical protein
MSYCQTRGADGVGPRGQREAAETSESILVRYGSLATARELLRELRGEPEPPEAV